MRISRLYVDADLSLNTPIALPSTSSHYLAKVLRIKVGASIKLFNGKGFDYSAQVSHINKHQVTVEALDRQPSLPPSPLRTHLGQVISRGERMDYVIQKACELGVNDITPLISKRCEVKLDHQRQQKRLDHWQNIAVSACEQSGRGDVPKIHPPVNLLQWMMQMPTECKLVFHLSPATTHLAALAPPLSCALLVGPEGGLTDAEHELASSHGFDTINLGQRTLRTETAPLVALSLLQYLWGDLTGARL